MSKSYTLHGETEASYQITDNCGLVYTDGNSTVALGSEAAQEMILLFEKEVYYREDILNELRKTTPELESNEAYVQAVVDEYADLRTDAQESWDICVDLAFEKVDAEDYEGISAPDPSGIRENGDAEVPGYPSMVIPAAHMREITREYNKEVFYRQDVLDEIRERSPELEDNEAYVEAVLDVYACRREDANGYWRSDLNEAFTEIDPDKYSKKKEKDRDIER